MHEDLDDELDQAEACQQWLSTLSLSLEHGSDLALSFTSQERTWPELSACVGALQRAFVERAALAIKTGAIEALSSVVRTRLAGAPIGYARKGEARFLAQDFAASASALVRILELRDESAEEVADETVPVAEQTVRKEPEVAALTVTEEALAAQRALEATRTHSSALEAAALPPSERLTAGPRRVQSPSPAKREPVEESPLARMPSQEHVEGTESSRSHMPTREHERERDERSLARSERSPAHGERSPDSGYSSFEDDEDAAGVDEAELNSASALAALSAEPAPGAAPAHLADVPGPRAPAARALLSEPADPLLPPPAPAVRAVPSQNADLLPPPSARAEMPPAGDAAPPAVGPPSARVGVAPAGGAAPPPSGDAAPRAPRAAAAAAARTPPVASSGPPPAFVRHAAATCIQRFSRRWLVCRWVRLSHALGRLPAAAAARHAAPAAQPGRAPLRAARLFTGRVHVLSAVVVDDDDGPRSAPRGRLADAPRSHATHQVAPRLSGVSARRLAEHERSRDERASRLARRPQGAAERASQPPERARAAPLGRARRSEAVAPPPAAAPRAAERRPIGGVAVKTSSSYLNRVSTVSAAERPAELAVCERDLFKGLANRLRRGEGGAGGGAGGRTAPFARPSVSAAYGVSPPAQRTAVRAVAPGQRAGYAQSRASDSRQPPARMAHAASYGQAQPSYGRRVRSSGYSQPPWSRDASYGGLRAPQLASKSFSDARREPQRDWSSRQSAPRALPRAMPPRGPTAPRAPFSQPRAAPPPHASARSLPRFMQPSVRSSTLQQSRSYGGTTTSSA